jgi:hypothetical protein
MPWSIASQCGNARPDPILCRYYSLQVHALFSALNEHRAVT